LFEEAPRLIHEVVKTLVAAVDELTGTRHSVLDLLEREARWVPGAILLRARLQASQRHPIASTAEGA
jgi:hypothetical protein